MRDIYQKLTKRSDLFLKLTGYHLNEFTDLFNQFYPIWYELKQEKVNAWAQLRTAGAGRKYCISLQNQVLAVILWKQLSLTTEALSQIFEVHTSTISRHRKQVITILEGLHTESTYRLAPIYYRPRSIHQVIEEHPELSDLLA